MVTDAPTRDRLTLTIEEAAQMLGIGRQLAYEMARSGAIPVIRLGRRMVVPRARLDQMLGVSSASGSPSEHMS